jgi:alkylated DNA repair dioxygenase AlkB
LRVIAERLAADGYFDAPPDQCIVNEYLPGQGIAPHIDCEPCFGDTIASASLSLSAPVVMEFSSAGNDGKHSVWLARRSLVVLKGPARYEWRHGIARRRKDVIDGIVVPRSRRVSLTFRSVVIP